MKKLIGAMLITSLLRVSASAQGPNAERPNILFLLADDMGWFDLGCYGNEIVKTPNLDKLASQGVRLSDCHSASPNCSPSRAGILTGRHPYRVGMYDFAHFKDLHIPLEETSVATLLKKGGYQTFFAGKWHLSGDWHAGTQPFPGDHGFDHWYAHRDNFGHNPEGFMRNGEELPAQEGWMSEILVNEAMTWLKKRDKTKPFCTFLWFSEPHVPVVAAEEFKAPYRTAEVKEKVKKLKFGGPGVARKPAADGYIDYFGCVSMLDHHIGRLMDFLKEQGLEKNTIVVFTSDNGPEHRSPTAYGSPGDFRGAKGYVYEGGIHVPGIVRWPGKIKPNTWNDTPVNGTDYLPTFCALAGVPVDVKKHIDGANVMPALTGEGTVDRKTPMFWWLYHARGGKEVAMRDGNLKILAHMTPSKPNPLKGAQPPKEWSIMKFIREAKLDGFEVHDLEKDPNETTDIKSDIPEKFIALKEEFIKLHEEISQEGPTYNLGSGGNKPGGKKPGGKKKGARKKGVK